MKNKLFIILTLLFLFGLIFCGLSIIGNAVGLKYATNEYGDCISMTTGKDLCKAHVLWLSLSILSGVGLITTIIIWIKRK